jgi:hypothetical protein
MLSGTLGLHGFKAPDFPYAPAAGLEGSTAIAFDDSGFQGWATDVIEVEYGLDVAEEWMNPEAALGPAGTGDVGVLVLGRGGSAVLECNSPIRDGEGDDFAVFENSFSATFLELAYIEVSSDGVHFTRFPNYSQTALPVPGFGTVQPEFVHGFGGKYMVGYGTPFDVQVLVSAHEAVLSGYLGFSPEFSGQLTANFPYLDTQAIRFVRIVDIPGDGSELDCEGFPIYDPYPTFISAGFDLDAIGVINSAPIPVVTFTDWSSGYEIPAEPGADLDGDGWIQYMEYLFATNPLDSKSLPVIVQEVNSPTSYSLVFWKNLAAETTPRIEVSVDAINWQEPLTVEIENIETQALGELKLGLVQVTLPLSSPATLVRFTAE